MRGRRGRADEILQDQAAGDRVGVARLQQHHQAFSGGIGQPGPQWMEAIPGPECRGGPLLIVVRDDQRRVQVDNQPAR